MLSNETFAYKSASSLFSDQSHFPSVRRRPLLFELASTPTHEPLNRDEFLLTHFLDIAENKNIKIPITQNGPYWLKNTQYNPLEIFGTCVQFFDQHTGTLPITTIPPSYDVEKFINTTLQQDGFVTADRQFKILLDITNGDVAGAANIGMLATRYMSRFSIMHPHKPTKCTSPMSRPLRWRVV